MEDWNPHDLRRTLRTNLSRLGCPADIAEAVLGHSKKGIEGTYNLHTYEREFYIDESRSEQSQQTHDLSHVEDIQKGLQQSVQALN